MSEQKQGIYEFHDFQLDIGKGVLLRENEPVSMQWKTFELLCVLAESGGHLVTLNELMERLWAETFVEENNLRQHISALRKILGERENGNGSGAKFIETVPRRGYRFLPEVRVIEPNQVEQIRKTPHQTPTEKISDKPAFESLTIVQPTIDSRVSGNDDGMKAVQTTSPEDSAIVEFDNESTENASAINQETDIQPKITNRRQGLQRGLKFFLWGLVIGFCFFILLQTLKILSVAFFATSNNLSNEILEMLVTLIGLLSIVVLAGWFIGIGLCLFGIIRMIFALFEKESFKWNSSFIERWIAIVLISVIAAVVIPNLIASYRAAQEFRRQQNQKPASDLSSSEAPFLDFSSAKYKKIIENQRGEAAISPDGKFVVYTNIVGDRQTLWLRQLAANTNIQIQPPIKADYRRLKFSHDNEYIYFNHTNNLYRVSVLGGASVLMMQEIEQFSFSPDEKQIAFSRHLRDPTENQCGLFIANADGGAARMISRRQSPDCYKSVAWSPDGKTIVFAVGQSDTGDANTRLFAYQIAEEKETPLSETRWFHINSLAWLPDRSGIILTGRKRLSDSNHLWQVNFPGGETRQLTNGTERYIHVSLTADGSRLLVTQAVLDSYLAVAPANAPAGLRKIGSGFYGLTWLPDGKIVYSSHAERDSLWTISADGSEQRQLTFDDAAYLNPIASADGRYIFYTLSGEGRQHIWRMNADGSDKIQLTDGDGEQKPNVSADGKWLFYQSSGEFPKTVWKVSTDGGEPVQVTTDYSINPSVSPDGKRLAYFGRREPDKDIMTLKVTSLEDGQIVKEFLLPDGEFVAAGRILWTKDGSALIYAREKLDRIPNIWSQPLDGSAPQQLTNYHNERIFDFDWSPDGKQLAIIRGAWKNEAVLINNFK